MKQDNSCHCCRFQYAKIPLFFHVTFILVDYSGYHFVLLLFFPPSTRLSRTHSLSVAFESETMYTAGRAWEIIFTRSSSRWDGYLWKWKNFESILRYTLMLALFSRPMLTDVASSVFVVCFLVRIRSVVVKLSKVKKFFIFKRECPPNIWSQKICRSLKDVSGAKQVFSLFTRWCQHIIHKVI